jgi:hypothetical protein
MGNRCLRPKFEQDEEVSTWPIDKRVGYEQAMLKISESQVTDRQHSDYDDDDDENDWETSQFNIQSLLNAQENSSSRTLPDDMDDDPATKKISSFSVDSSVRSVRFAEEFLQGHECDPMTRNVAMSVAT